MRSLAILLVLFGLVLPGYSQRHITGDGSDYKETRSLSSFDRVHLSCSVEVVVVKGDSFSIRLEGERNIIEVLETDVKGGELNIHYPLFKDFRATKPLRCLVTTNDVSEISNSGSGRIQSEDRFKSAALSIHNSGSGRIEWKLAADKVHIGTSGSGHIQLKGQAKELECNVSGSGRVEAGDLEIRDRSDIHISGSGSCTVTTNGVIQGRISGSGGIYYKGNPGNVDVTHSGSGRAHKID
jgi:Putative auto-transporter adhesin, head GIN domain